MFRGSPALLGVSPSTLPAKLQLLWSFKTGAPVKSSAAIKDHRVFIGSDDGQTYSLDFITGKKLWAFKTGGPVESSPLLLEGKIFFGSTDGFLYALKADTGAVLTDGPGWNKRGRSPEAAPALAVTAG